VADKLSEEEIRTKNIEAEQRPVQALPIVQDIMLDLETLGVKDNCPILSIAAIVFNRAQILQDPSLSIESGSQSRNNLHYIDTFRGTFSLLDSIASGCVIEQGTAAWWLKQADRTQLVEAMSYLKPIEDTLIKFKAFLSLHDYGSIWAKSPTFDISLLRSFASIKSFDIGIHFRKEADVRTEVADYPQFDVVKLSKDVVINDSLGNPLRPHDPIYDCIIQIQAVQEVYAKKFATTVKS
jgi:exodeoxyribonuclease VIII